ncbi:MAG: DUF4397 domain-containing protein [Gemmatimonadaceae bacterium]|nr:DUF4397 domain-containing protein [Gemmatimonadaceae bacterium]
MTSLRSIRSIAGRVTAVLAAVALLGACEKNAVQDITGTLPGSRIRFFNFGVGAPGVHFYANDAKLTATTSATGAESTTGVAYGGVGSSGFYSAINPGQYTFTARIVATVDKDLAVGTVSSALEANKNYTMYLSGTYNTTAKTIEAFIVEDAIPEAFDYTQSLVRLVNASANSQPMILYARNQVTGTEVPIGGAVAYKTAGAFTPVPMAVYDLFLRTPGSTTNLVTRTGVSFIAGRSHTIAVRGTMGTTGTSAPAMDYTNNR